jgi:peptide/nickel transport system ATP-binding protein
VILDPQHDYTRLLATAAPDPARPGKVIATEIVIDRSTIDNSACFNHHTAQWEQSSREGPMRHADPGQSSW